MRRVDAKDADAGLDQPAGSQTVHPELGVVAVVQNLRVLARDRVRFIGEKVAVVAATEPEIAEEALALIDVEYEDLPATVDLAKALESGAPVVHENPGAYEGAPKERPHPNVQSVLRFKLGDVAAGFREAARIFEHTFRTQLAHQGYLEPHAGVVAIDADGRVQVWASNKMPFRLKELLSHALRPSSLTLLTVAGLNVGALIGGLVELGTPAADAPAVWGWTPPLVAPKRTAP